MVYRGVSIQDEACIGDFAYRCGGCAHAPGARRRVKVGRRSALDAGSAVARPHLDGGEHNAMLQPRGMNLQPTCDGWVGDTTARLDWQRCRRRLGLGQTRARAAGIGRRVVDVAPGRRRRGLRCNRNESSASIVAALIFKRDVRTSAASKPDHGTARGCCRSSAGEAMAVAGFGVAAGGGQGGEALVERGSTDATSLAQVGERHEGVGGGEHGDDAVVEQLGLRSPVPRPALPLPMPALSIGVEH